MEKNILENQFIDYYLNENRIESLKEFSQRISYDTIINLNSELILIGNKTITIPENINEEKYNNNVEIDGFTNNQEKVYYVDPSLKKYYQLGKDIIINDFQLKQNENISFDFEYKSDGTTIESFIVIEFSEHKGTEARSYKDLNDIKFTPHEEATKLKIYLVPSKEGFLYDLDFQVEKNSMELINDYTLPVQKDILYNPDQRVAIKDTGGKLLIEVPDLQKKFIYFSYAIMNNSFNKIPEESLIEVDSNNLYHIQTPFNLLDELDFTPTIIEYNTKGKTHLKKLSNNAEFVKFQKDTIAIRLSYRFSGIGKVEINDISIKEYKPESDYTAVEWASRYEIDKYMNGIEKIEDLRISAIMDEFTYHSYKYEADIQRLTFDNWKNEIISFMPHMVFIESSWHGNEGEWSKKIAYVTEEKHSYIKHLISFTKSLGIPVVFWNKEDPVHYDHFIETAKLCDYVFTTDSDRIPDYKRDCDHENIDVLQFAAQPKTHNPIKIQKERVDGISFAGSYYALREERSRDMDRLFKASIPYGLYIYDRNYEATQRGEKLNFLFPEKFREYILGSLPFHQIDKAYKGYKFMININTVKTSPTMYARRVYEGLASGTPIISNYSLGMEKQFGDLIGYSENEDDLESYLNRLLEDESEYNKTKQLGIRRVLSEHTYTQRLYQIAENIGYKLKKENFDVTFISFVENENDTERAIQIFNEFNYNYKNLIIFVNEEIASYSFAKQKITLLKEKDLEHFFITFSQIKETDFIAPINVKDFYGKGYLTDLLLANHYTTADIIGKKNYYINDGHDLKEIHKASEYEYVDNVNIYASIVRANILANLSLNESLEYLKGTKSLSELKYLGIRIFSNDKMNYLKNYQESIKKFENIVDI